MASHKLFKHMKCAANGLVSFNTNIYWGFRSSSTALKVSRTVLCLKPFNNCVFCCNLRKFHKCNFMKTDDTSVKANEKCKDERVQGLLDDDEFQNILKDFANDFGVTDETSKILDDIRKSLDEPELDSDKLSENNGKNGNICVTNIDLHSEADVKYKTFSDSDAVVIHSYEDYQSSYDEKEQTYHVDQDLEMKHFHHEMKRGIHGVFDIEELVEVLRKENLLDITVISVPKDLHYTDFMVLATAKSPRHCKAASELISKLYKMKKHKTDPFVIIEGQAVSNWKAIDMGNIVLHIFLEDVRALYDIESLWLFDANFDTQGNLKTDPMLDTIEEQMAFFNALQQSTSNKSDKEVV